MELLFGISIPFFLLAGGAIVLTGTIWYFYRKAKRTLKNLFGTDSINELIKTREQQEANTPKSVSGMTNIYAPLIQEDFPELNLIELKGIAEQHLLTHLTQQSFASPRIHKTEVLRYIKKSGTCVIIFQSGVQYFSGTKKIQSRYNTYMMYIQDAIEYGQGTGFSVNCPNCGGAISNLGAKHCEYCGSEILPINIHVWDLHKIEEA